jgi:restriction system protein
MQQWRREKVPVNVVREMYGLLAHHGADEVRIAALGGFTPDAARFAEGKPMELIDGPSLLTMIRRVQTVEPRSCVSPSLVPASRTEPVFDVLTVAPPSAPACPRCGTAMVERTNLRAANTFWGCLAYPACRGTR